MDARTQKQLDEIGTRYIRRALTQLNDVKELVARLHDSDDYCLSDFDSLTHQIHGTAAMFGFHPVSAAAGRINALLKSFDANPSNWNLSALDLLMIELGDSLHECAASRNRRSADHRPQGPQHRNSRPQS